MELKQPRKGTEIMKKTLLLSLLLLLVTATLLLVGCGDPSANLPEEGTSVTTAAGNIAGTVAETTAETADPYEGLSSAEREIREIADRALKEKYSLPGWENFDIRIDYGVNGNTNIYVRYDFTLGGYNTYEDYQVTLNAQLAVTQVDGDSVGKYSRYLSVATPSAMAAAEASLAEQMGHLADKENSGYYLSIDDEGYLCLSCEVIVQLSGGADGDGGCGIDHEHKFFTARIYGVE